MRRPPPTDGWRGHRSSSSALRWHHPHNGSSRNDHFIPQFRKDVLGFAANAVYYATGLIVIAGAAAFVLSKDIRRSVLLAALLYVLAIPLIFFGDPRFHYPAIPLAVIVAAATLVALWERRHRPLVELRA